MSKTYSDKLKDPRWQKKRLEVFNRDRWRCRDCSDDESELQVHHCHYLPRTEPWDNPDEVLMTLCPACHQRRQGREVALHVTLAKILAATPVDQIEAMFWLLLAKWTEMERGDPRNVAAFECGARDIMNGAI